MVCFQKALHTCLLLICTLLLWACGGNTQALDKPAAQAGAKITLSSAAFQPDQPIPQKYTCDGQNVSPALAWQGLPQGTASLALVVEDPDAPMGTFTHWLLYNIPPAQASLPEGAAGIGTGGKSGFGNNSYGGPCPPGGKAHHYVFKLYALELAPDLPAGLNEGQLASKLEGHVLGAGQIVGTYQR